MPISGGAGILTIVSAAGVFNNPLHWWKLSDISGTTAPDSGSSTNTGATTGSPGSQTGPQGGAVYATAPSFVKASAQDVFFSNATNFDWSAGGSFTVAGWFYITDNTALSEDAVNNQQYFYDDRTGDGLNYIRIFNSSTSAGLVGFDVCGSRLVGSAGNVPNNTWTHVTCVNTGGGSGGTFSLYINGSVTGSTQSSPGNTSFNEVVSHLAHGTIALTAGGLTGSLSSVRIYGRALSATDISALYAAGG